MNRQPVTSSQINSIGYDEAQRLLEVEFKNKTVYQFEEVPRKLWWQLMAAPSVGVFFSNNIRGHYNGKKTE